MSVTEIDGGVQVGDRTSGSRGPGALTAPQSLAGAEDYRVRHLLRNGRRVTTRDLAIKREDGETVLPDPAVIAQVQEINRARQAPPLVVDERDAWSSAAAEEREEEETVRPMRRRRRTETIARAQPVDFFRDDRPREAVVAHVPTIAYLEQFEEKIAALIVVSEKRILKRVQQLIDQALEEIDE